MASLAQRFDVSLAHLEIEKRRRGAASKEGRNYFGVRCLVSAFVVRLAQRYVLRPCSPIQGQKLKKASFNSGGET